MFVNPRVQHGLIPVHSTKTNPQICVSLFRAKTSPSVEENIMFTAPSKVTSLSLTTLKALKSKRRSTRFDGCPRKTLHNSFCPLMVGKTINSYHSVVNRKCDLYSVTQNVLFILVFFFSHSKTKL